MIGKAFILVAAVACLSAAEEDDGNARLMMKLATECGRRDDFGGCLKMRALTFLDKLVNLPEPVYVTDYVKLVRDPKAAIEGASDGSRTGARQTTGTEQFLGFREESQRERARRGPAEER